jgi:hypothetical protein
MDQPLKLLVLPFDRTGAKLKRVRANPASFLLGYWPMLNSSGPLVDSCKATDDTRRDVQLVVPCEDVSITLEAIGQHPFSDRWAWSRSYAL